MSIKRIGKFLRQGDIDFDNVSHAPNASRCDSLRYSNIGLINLHTLDG